MGQRFRAAPISPTPIEISPAEVAQLGRTSFNADECRALLDLMDAESPAETLEDLCETGDERAALAKLRAGAEIHSNVRGALKVPQ
jgi:hypothetical protein